MAAQPPHHSRTAEIDIREILADSGSKQAPPVPIGGGFDPVSSPTGAGLLRTHHASRIGWPDWANVLFAVLMVAGGLLSTFRYFDSHEVFRSRHLREKELLYGRPVNFSSDVPDQMAEQTATSSRTPPGPAPSGAATGTKDLNEPANSGPVYRSPAGSTPGSNFTNLPNGGTGDQRASNEARRASSSTSERSTRKVSRQKAPPKTRHPSRLQTHSLSQGHFKFFAFFHSIHSKQTTSRTSSTAAARSVNGVHSKQAGNRTSLAAAARPSSSETTHSFDHFNTFNSMAVESLRRGTSPDTRMRPAMERVVGGRHGRQ